jgi:circadian clock protein KaiC
MRSNELLVRTGIAGLDDVLGGGLTPNRLYLVEGDPGSGKTTLGLQFLMDGREKGEKGIYVTLSETNDELLAVARAHGWSLEGIDVTELAPPEESLDADAENTFFYPSAIELSETTKAVLREVEAVKPARIVFDSLSEMRLLAQNPLRYRRQILALKHFFIGRQCTVLLLDDRTSDAADLQLHSIAHGVITLERKAPEFGVMQRRVHVQKMRGRDFRAGFHDYVIRRGGLVVFPRLVAADHIERYENVQVKSGIAELDQLMGGGPDKGTSTLLLGPAGTGKSSIATQYAVTAAARGERAALFLFDESERTLLHRSEGLGMPLKKYVDAGLIALHQVDPGTISVGELIHGIREEVAKGARLLVIDSLNGYLNAMPEVRFLSIQLHELLTYLGQSGVTTLLVVAQQGMVGQMSNPIDASYLADSVIMLRHFEAAGRLRQAISVMKKRSGAHERSIREYSFSRAGISIGPPLADFQGVLAGTPQFLGPKADPQAALR